MGRKTVRTCIVLAAVVFGLLSGMGGGLLRAHAGTIHTSHYVRFSPDGKAWTTDSGNRNVEWYADDGTDDVITGIKGDIREIRTGEHFYAIKRTGIIPIAKWHIYLSKVNCCHNSYPQWDNYHGVYYTKENCYIKHFSAWHPICADCGEPIVYGHFYLSKAAAESIDYLEVGKEKYYYYLCPFNNNLEQGMELNEHDCKAISANRYKVHYDANASDIGGYMEPSFHMYDNSLQYEGKDVTPQTHLNHNAYTRIGWEFVCWNTKADGSGENFEDGAEILNLCEGDYNLDKTKGSVRLYAIWRRSESGLGIDPAGGSYDGQHGITYIWRKYGDTYTIDVQKLTAPEGCLVSFDTGGGDPVNPMRGTQHFISWRQRYGFEGKLQGNSYTFCGKDGNIDYIEAVYERDSIILPTPVRENYSFGGWYYDKDFDRPVGKGGTEFIPTLDLTLYAQWVELILDAEDNYAVNEGAGAVNLEWSQPDGREKVYKLYQSRDLESWEQIYAKDNIKEEELFEKEYYYVGAEGELKISYAGYYYMEAYGAQGGNYEEYSGGSGGKVSGRFWIDKDDLISYGVGGQNGYNGGGKGNKFANGGGYSMVESEEYGILLLAGGGGGAGESGNGYEGGSEQSLVSKGHIGESGGAGGGGGYLGGKAGVLKVHNHVDGICNHIHIGNPNTKGGCYTVKVTCGETLKHEFDHTDKWYWGGSDESYCPNCGADASKGQSCTGHETDYYRHICPVHGKVSTNKKSNSPSKCTKLAGYDVGCGKTEEYICGFPYDGYVISSKPAFGGSNYVNTDIATDYETSAGVRTGDGYIIIKSEQIGFWQDNSLNDVMACDKDAPDIIQVSGVSKTPVDEESVKIQWEESKDNGTLYYHKAESYDRQSAEKLSVSNITANTLISGTKGYRYCIDTLPDTEVNDENGVFSSEREVIIKLLHNEQYLHILAEDVAGNRSDTVHINVGSMEGGVPDVVWPIVTEQISLNMGDNIYPAEAEDTYYVRCDGITPIILYYASYLKGPASEDYQPNYAIIESMGFNEKKIRQSVYVPSCMTYDREWKITASQLRFYSTGKGYLTVGNYVMASRDNKCERLEMAQEMIPDNDMHEKMIHLIPIAGAENKNEIVYSDYEQDKENGIWVIGDGEAPEIRGMEVLDNLDILDRRDTKIKLKVSAEDELSGLKELYLVIENMDNGCMAEYHPDEDGVIVVDICVDEAIFSGDFRVTAYAVDNVGNENSITCSTLEFDLNAEIERVLSPHDPRFKRGESGYLRITSWGYADRVEVEFPEEFVLENPDINRVYVYETNPMYKHYEVCEFMIPLYVPENTKYTVTVRAYKGDRMLERHPALAVLGVEGTVLDELRTRLR